MFEHCSVVCVVAGFEEIPEANVTSARKRQQYFSAWCRSRSVRCFACFFRVAMLFTGANEQKLM